MEKRKNVECQSEGFREAFVDSLLWYGGAASIGFGGGAFLVGKFSFPSDIFQMLFISLGCGIGGGLGAYAKRRKLEKEENKVEVSFLEKYAARILLNEEAYQYALLPTKGTT